MTAPVTPAPVFGHIDNTTLGAGLMTIGQGVTVASVVLPDGTPGSLRDIAIAFGGILTAVGAFLIRQGHKAAPVP